MKYFFKILFEQYMFHLCREDIIYYFVKIKIKSARELLGLLNSMQYLAESTVAVFFRTNSHKNVLCIFSLLGLIVA